MFYSSGDDVVFLDPHITQNTIVLDDEPLDDSSYHPETCARICFQSMDPSLAVVWFFLNNLPVMQLPVVTLLVVISVFLVHHTLNGQTCFSAFSL